VDGAFDEKELQALREGANRELLAGLAHRFQTTATTTLGDADDPSFVGRVLAGSVISASLIELNNHVPRLVANATERRERERTLCADPMGGPLDLGRVALAPPEVGLWPIIRIARSKNTPENALLLATLATVFEWSSGRADAYASWSGRELFARAARRAHELRETLQKAFGRVPLEEVGSARLVPLALERVALRQADPTLYRRPIELARTMQGMIDPQRQLAQEPDSKRLVDAMLGGLNEYGLQHTAFELWVASRLVCHGEEQGFEFEFPFERKSPFAVGLKARTGERLEVWWQASAPLVVPARGRDHEIERDDGSWQPITLRPDLVLRRQTSAEQHLLCVECKNKQADAPLSRDLAQAFGYLSHFRGLPSCALVYRGLPSQSHYRRASTAQTATALAAPVGESDAGKELLGLLLKAGVDSC